MKQSKGYFVISCGDTTVRFYETVREIEEDFELKGMDFCGQINEYDQDINYWNREQYMIIKGRLCNKVKKKVVEVWGID